MSRPSTALHPTPSRSLDGAGPVLKAQQALVRSCLAACTDPGEAELLDALLAALTDIRRRHRALQRLWDSLPSPAVAPPALVGESVHLSAEWRAVEAELERCREQALARTALARRTLWRRIRDTAERHV